MVNGCKVMAYRLWVDYPRCFFVKATLHQYISVPEQIYHSIISERLLIGKTAVSAA
jgi:hypothetical protein